MLLLGFTLLGVVIFYGLILAVIVGGAVGNKHEKELRELTEQQQAAGLTGDTTMNDPFALDYNNPRHART
ncbi:hypothetical protein [Pyxidicoccus trucidator]|uniref:hypothetical protein n=1 Tax=Pyxidicoccus trucidator TaxID=2709662 RepID=UPI0013DBBCB9|nr:hypothetical protein [Pyxidicoccus trucidator]